MQGMQVRSLVRELRSPMLWQLSLSETISLRAALKTQCSKKKKKKQKTIIKFWRWGSAFWVWTNPLGDSHACYSLTATALSSAVLVALKRDKRKTSRKIKYLSKTKLKNILQPRSNLPLIPLLGSQDNQKMNKKFLFTCWEIEKSTVLPTWIIADKSLPPHYNFPVIFNMN